MALEKTGETALLQEGDEFDNSIMRLNTDEAVLLDNIKRSIRRQLPQLYPFPNNPNHVAIVGGGWSLNETVEDLRQLHFDGVKIVALNGSAKWLMERNLRPSMHVVIDGRPQNAEFVREAIPRCKYFLASQCAPEVFDAVEGRDVTLFHGTSEASDPENAVLNEFYGENRWVRVPPAGMVGITTLLLLRILGFQFMHLFGLDACFDPKTGAHHGFSQPMNDKDTPIFVKVAGREFMTSPALASSAINFMNVLHKNGHLFSLEVYGEGMLAHIMKTAATADDLENFPATKPNEGGI